MTGLHINREGLTIKPVKAITVAAQSAIYNQISTDQEQQKSNTGHVFNQHAR